HLLDGRLGRFQGIASQPGLPRALARTISELRLAQVSVDSLDPDLQRVARAFEGALAEIRIADEAQVLRLAIAAVKPFPTLLLDVELRSALEAELVKSLSINADLFATVPHGDERTLNLLESALGVRAERHDPPRESGVARLQQNLFGAEKPAKNEPAEDVELLSAPGEFRECIEVARALQREAARGVPFDRMAVLLRAPGAYRAAMTEALRRADISAYFVRGTLQPDPAGRALLALLACADEGLSASLFAEYLSLGEVPKATTAGAPPAAPSPGERWREPDSEEAPEEAPSDDNEEEALSDTAPVVAGTLRAPRRWEKLLVEAAVIGGRDRWRKRLLELDQRYRAELASPSISEPNGARVGKALSDLTAFTGYALPLIDVLSALPREALWSEWLERLTELSTRALRKPDRVLSVLAELAPLGVVGPVTLAEVRKVLAERLLQLTVPPPQRRFGAVFVGPVDAARGMAFDVVFVPGLAERIFPQKVREDPIAPDAERRRLSDALEVDADRVVSERLQLQLAVGAATSRVVLSYPRIDGADARPRVPSFYGLEALRAVEGKLPRYEELRRRAERAVDARIGWPAPRNADTAIDIAERDLSVLDELFRGSTPPPRGAARYLTQVNPFLARALRARYARWHSAWGSWDGLVKPSADALAALAPHQLGARAFSATALQHYAACPYRFFLSGILRLSPREEPVAIEELDPLQKGSMVHEVHYTVLSTLREGERLPITPQSLDAALATLDSVIQSVARKYEELYAPAIDRVWQDTLVAMRADAREWLRMTARETALWAPWKFELAFGLGHREQQDPESRADPVEIEGGLRLRGSIDLVEIAPDGTLRATDYKTGRARAEVGALVGGGKSLQPVLYSLALEKLFPEKTVSGGRLFYCTQAGQFSEVFIPLNATSREAGVKAVKTIGQALEKGFLPAAPAKEECTYCDYRSVCGTDEQRRTELKPKGPLEPLIRLRALK
ncbi:MAG: PD-(D/E)XK nuclease family protein, partial [Myxococcaceae bacterium]